MSFYTIYDNTGKIVAVTLNDMGDDYELTPQYAGMNLLAGKGNRQTQYVLNGVLTDYTADQLAEIAGMVSGQAWSLPSCTVVDNRQLSDVQAARSMFIVAAWASAMAANITYIGTNFQADSASLALMNDTLSASGGTLPTGFAWFDANNAPVVMTFAQLQSLANAIFLRGIPLFVQKKTLQAQIAAATTISTVESIMWVPA